MIICSFRGTQNANSVFKGHNILLLTIICIRGILALGAIYCSYTRKCSYNYNFQPAIYNKEICCKGYIYNFINWNLGDNVLYQRSNIY